MKKVFAPGCALLIHNPELADRIAAYLKDRHNLEERHTMCCHFRPDFSEPVQIISICSGCIRRYDSLYKDVSAVSLWELADKDPHFPFPDYGGMRLSVIDACPTRNYIDLHETIRSILSKMNIQINEAERTGTGAKCCGDSFYGRMEKSAILEKMRERAEEMPEENVAVYCVSCIKSVTNGGKSPKYLPDLLFGTETFSGECDPDLWHGELNKFIRNSR